MSGHTESEEAIAKKLSEIEKEIRLIKILILLKPDYTTKSKLVSFRGMAKPLVPEEEILKSIEEAKASLFKSRL